MNESNNSWFLSNLLTIQALPVYSEGVVEEPNMGVFTAEWNTRGEKEDMWKNAQHTFMTPETHWTHSPSPSSKEIQRK